MTPKDKKTSTTTATRLREQTSGALQHAPCAFGPASTFGRTSECLRVQWCQRQVFTQEPVRRIGLLRNGALLSIPKALWRYGQVKLYSWEKKKKCNTWKNCFTMYWNSAKQTNSDCLLNWDSGVVQMSKELAGEEFMSSVNHRVFLPIMLSHFNTVNTVASVFAFSHGMH